MNVGVYTGAAALNAYERWQDTIARNISSASVPGYKKTETVFKGAEQKTTAAAQTPGSDMLPSTLTRINFEPGQLRATGSELDFAIQGSGFFKVQQPDGSMAYTRDGEFRIGPDKTLLTKQGLVVQGESGPITFKDGSGPIRINEEGVITQREEAVGKLPVFDFADPQSLERTGNGFFKSNAAPQALERTDVVNGFVEGSNVSALTEMVNLITVSRAYAAGQKIVQSSDDTMAKAIEILGNPNS